MSFAIDAANLRKSYGDLVAVDGLSLSIPPGETFGLLGPNGAGKSTTISILTGLLSPDSGQVLISGEPTGTASARMRVGLAPQEIALYGELTAEENLQFFAGLYPLKRQEVTQRVDEMLKLAQLEDRRRHKVSTFSGGMKRRLNLAAALLHRPDVLLLDEPTAGVDPQSRNHLLDWVQQLAKEGLTVLYTTHYMEEAERLCDRIGIMDHGKLLAVGSTTELTRDFAAGSVVTFQSNTTKELASLPADFPQLDSNGRTYQFDSSDPQKHLAVLQQHSIAVHQLEIRPPHLEGVFLRLTGRQLRDG